MSYRAENGLKGNSFFRNADLYGLSYPVLSEVLSVPSLTWSTSIVNI